MSETSPDAIHPAALPPDILHARCQETRTRRSGPGGQHRNKVETAVVLLEPQTGISAEASERRSQSDNRRMAIFRLRLNLALGFRLNPLPADAPSEVWNTRCRNGRISINPSHDDFPSLLAEALDRIVTCDWDVSAAAGQLHATTSQIIRLLKHEPRAMTLVNRERQSRDLRPYK
tara:strand:- start:26361 stop:26885 length:525 start_codon:yes stop_codon:yes gene_type:complete